ncbi:glycoprotein [Pseudomonas aeruginosa]
MKYEVVRPWHGVAAGDVVEIDDLHPALKANVRPLKGEVAELVPASPEATAPKRGRPAKSEAE